MKIEIISKQQTNSKQMLDYLSEPLFLGLVFNFSPSFCLPDIPSFVHSGLGHGLSIETEPSGHEVCVV